MDFLKSYNGRLPMEGLGLIRTGLLSFLLLCGHSVFAEDSVENFYWGQGSDSQVEGSSAPESETTVSQPQAPVIEEPAPAPVVDNAPKASLIPLTRPQFNRPGVQVLQSLDPRHPIFNKYANQAAGGTCGAYKNHNTAFIWPFFTHSFGQCAPGCSPGINSTRGCRKKRKSGRLSCHQKDGAGYAIDLDFIECSGTKYGPGDLRFYKLHECMNGKAYNGPERTPFKRKWVSLYQDRGDGCAGVGYKSPLHLRTTCHWNHIHLDLGCY